MTTNGTQNQRRNAHGVSRRKFLKHSSVLFGFGAFYRLLVKRAWAQPASFVITETSFGMIRGMEHRGIKSFKGIPYGASTSGRNRFVPPADPASWVGVRDAFEYGHSAPQSVPASPKRYTGPSAVVPKPALGPSIFRALRVPGAKNTGEGEDCLVLNIWTPALNDGGKRPVMIWLHGGGFRSGSGSSPGWNGTNLCLRGDVVVITINHRLNVCGFADFSAFNPDFAASGQAGLLDIIHALKWVRTNIAQFGGDADTVMIFGQSGGGRKCEALLAMPDARGLFHRAAIESGIAIKVVDREKAIQNAEHLLGKLGVPKTQVHKVQQLPLDQIMLAAAEINLELGNVDLDTRGFAPSVDGHILPQHPFWPAASAVSAAVPVLIGSTRTEYTGLTTEATLWHLDENGLQSRIQELLGERSQAMIKLYRQINSGATPTDIFFLIQSDYRYVAKTIKIAEKRAALGKGPVYLYYFAWPSPVQGGQLKSPHNIEWPFAFDNVEICANLTGGGAAAQALADQVSDAWIAFARTGNPNTPRLPHWPEFNERERATMVIDKLSRVVNDPLREQRVAMFEALNLT